MGPFPGCIVGKDDREKRRRRDVASARRCGGKGRRVPKLFRLCFDFGLLSLSGRTAPPAFAAESRSLFLAFNLASHLVMNSELANVVFGYPAIDNHCHPILSQAHKDDFALEGIYSEAQGPALEAAENTLAGYRVTKQLAELFSCEEDWGIVKVKREKLTYDDLCRFSFERTGIQCLLLDDGLDAQDACEDVSWHDRFTTSPSKRIVRLEALAQVRKYIIYNREAI